MNNDQHGIRARGSGDGARVRMTGGSSSGTGHGEGIRAVPGSSGAGIKRVSWYRWRLWRLAWARKDALPYQDFLLLGHGEEWRRLCGRLWARAH